MICKGCVEKLPFLKDYADRQQSDLANCQEAIEVKEVICSKPENPSGDIQPHSLFLPENWRANLCGCKKCLNFYKENGCEFLMDPRDTVQFYESSASRGSANASGEGSVLDAGMRALQNMDRVSQVEMIQEYNSLKSNLTDYLKKFAESGKVVQEEDIKEFFNDLESRKRPRLELPKSCR